MKPTEAYPNTPEGLTIRAELLSRNFRIVKTIRFGTAMRGVTGYIALVLSGFGTVATKETFSEETLDSIN